MSENYELELTPEEEWHNNLQEQLRYELEYSEYLFDMDRKRLEEDFKKYKQLIEKIESKRRLKLMNFLREYRNPSILKRLINLYKIGK